LAERSGRFLFLTSGFGGEDEDDGTEDIDGIIDLALVHSYSWLILFKYLLNIFQFLLIEKD